MASTSSHPGRDTTRWAPAGFSVIVLLALMSASAGAARVELVPTQARLSVHCGVAPMVVVVETVEEPSLWRTPVRENATPREGVGACVPMVVREAVMDLPPPAMG